MTALELLTHVDNCLSRYGMTLSKLRILFAFAPDKNGVRPTLCAKDLMRDSRHKPSAINDSINHLERIGMLVFDRKDVATKFFRISRDGESIVREALSGK